MRRWAYNSADAIIVHASQQKRELKTFYKATTPVHILPHGSFTPILEPLGAIDSDRSRHILHIDKDRIVVLFFGSIQEYKGLDILIEAFSLAVKYHERLFMLIAGSYHGEWSSSSYKRSIDRYDLQSFVRERIGYIPLGEFPILFGAADIVALPYKTATQSGVAPTAYHYARPVIATPAGGLPEMVQHETTGLLLQRIDSEDFASALLRLAHDPGLRHRLGRGARSFSDTALNWDRIAQGHAALYAGHAA
jgi:glycosyltransferase involved in cell wall biosynthesis